MKGSCLYLSDSRRMHDSIPPPVVSGDGVQGKGGCFPLPLPSNVLGSAFFSAISYSKAGSSHTLVSVMQNQINFV
jgi:hypothetical protein